MSSTSCTQLLQTLIAHRTTNPGGDEAALCAFLAERMDSLGADSVDYEEATRACDEPGAYMFARFGQPRWLVNVHVDTVPVNAGWTRDPFRGEIDGDRLYGLGSADTKGAAAALLTAIEKVKPKDLAVLLSGDEEAGSHVLSEFLAGGRHHGLEYAIVCEPTKRRAGVRHRGIGGYRAELRGRGGHSSQADHMAKPVVTLARVAVGLDELGRDYLQRGPQDMKGLCMNVAMLEGGVAFNVIPEHTSLSWSVRPPPGWDETEFHDRQQRAIQAIDPNIELSTRLSHSPFATRDPQPFRDMLGGHATDFGPLQFWTEAAMLSAAGIDAVVIGPGNIEQAHAADEYVALADLDWATDMFEHVIARLNDASA